MITGIPLPPEEYINLIGGPGFRQIGEDFAQYFKDFCNLQDDENVLEIGCGVGRMAIPLVEHLQNGTYDGIDIVQQFIEWNTANITTKAPNFRFTWANIYNSFYNPQGVEKDNDYIFPYENQSFNFIILASVFTHMLEAGFVNYVSEIARMLKSRGRCFATFFLLNEAQDNLAKQGKNGLHFPVNHGKCKSMSGLFELAVSFQESFILKTFQAHSLEITEPVRYGCWSGRNNFVTYQDIVIVTKKP